MTRDEFNSFCKNMTATTHVVQWGNSDVWKVGGKVFAICGWNDDIDAFTFKASEIAFEVLQDMPGVRPALTLHHADSSGCNTMRLRGFRMTS